MADLLEITERKGVALATIMARKGVARTHLSKPLGLSPPAGPQVAGAGPFSLIGVGPGVWFAVREGGPEDWIDELRQALAGAASVSEQTGGYLVLRLTGPGAQALLQSGAFIDLDPAVFGVGAAAVTAIAHIGVILWKVDDGPTFDVALFRSFAGSFRDWVAANAGPPIPSL